MIYRKRWEKHHWLKDDGKPVENAEIIAPLAREIDRRIVGFRKIKGHSKDAWNDAADALAVKGRNQQAKEVTIQLGFRAVIDKREQFVGFPRFSVSSYANIHDFWPRLVDRCGEDIVEPEDCEIWQDRHKANGPSVMGLEYEIVSRTTPGFVKPSELKKQHRSSIDFGVSPEPEVHPPKKNAPKVVEVATPPRTRSKAEVQNSVPPHFRASVTYQVQAAPEKEWRGWFTEEDTEESLERRARNVLGILGSWRRLSFWRDHEGIRLVMTNKRKEVELRYMFEHDTEAKEVLISEDDTPKMITTKVGKKENFHVVDPRGNPSGQDDSLFGHATMSGALPVRIVHGSALRTNKTRVKSARKDNRAKMVIKSKEEKQEFDRPVYPTHRRSLEDCREAIGLPE
jgi:hypothetical protein